VRAGLTPAGLAPSASAWTLTPRDPVRAGPKRRRATLLADAAIGRGHPGAIGHWYPVGMTQYLGSCHCGGVRFQVETDEPLAPYFRCNCSLCARKGAVMGEAARSALRVTAGEDLLSTYTWNTGEAQHHFCKVCGIYTHHVMRGCTDRVGINMACIEGVDVFDVGEVVVGGGRRLSLVGGSPRRS